MKIDISRQPLLVALATLLVVVAVAFVRRCSVPMAPELIADPFAPLGTPLTAWQMNHPGWAALLAACFAFFCGLRAGHATVRHALFPVVSYLTIPLYGIIACGLFVGAGYLAEFVAALLLALSTRNLFAASRNGYAIGAIFRGAFYLGCVPLFVTAAWPLLLLILPATVCFRRTRREFLIALCGLLLPLAAACYLDWGFGAPFGELPVQLWQILGTDSGYGLFTDATLLSPLHYGLLLFLALCGTFAAAMNFRIISRKARGMITYLILLLISCCALFALPSATPALLGLFALPAAMLLPPLFQRLPAILSLALYFALFALSLAHLVV